MTTLYKKDPETFTTLGLIESIGDMVKTLASRDLSDPKIMDAILKLRKDDDIFDLFTGWGFSEDAEFIKKTLDGIKGSIAALNDPKLPPHVKSLIRCRIGEYRGEIATKIYDDGLRALWDGVGAYIDALEAEIKAMPPENPPENPPDEYLPPNLNGDIFPRTNRK